jgi:hypothetical protein
MSKIVIVLYPDPVDGFPPRYARDSIPAIERYPNRQATPTPSSPRWPGASTPAATVIRHGTVTMAQSFNGAPVKDRR